MQVKYKKPMGMRARKPGRPAGTASNGAVFSIDALVAAKKLVDRLGGIEAAENALSTLKRLGD
jgi:hypothetical protein